MERRAYRMSGFLVLGIAVVLGIVTTGQLVADGPHFQRRDNQAFALDAAQDLMLVQNNQSFWVLLHGGATVPPELQGLTLRSGRAYDRPVFKQTFDFKISTRRRMPQLKLIDNRSSATKERILDTAESLSPGQLQEIDRVYRLHHDLADDAFVADNLDKWLS